MPQIPWTFASSSVGPKSYVATMIVREHVTHHGLADTKSNQLFQIHNTAHTRTGGNTLYHRSKRVHIGEHDDSQSWTQALDQAVCSVSAGSRKIFISSRKSQPLHVTCVPQQFHFDRSFSPWLTSHILNSVVLFTWDRQRDHMDIQKHQQILLNSHPFAGAETKIRAF